MYSDIRLTRTVQSGGCAAKLSPDILSQALRKLPISKHPNLLVGLARPDDAGVYKLSPQRAIIQTVDFFPPIVDDPYLFGQIAAANALSDVYAMGGQPITAMNLVGFPAGKLPLEVLREMLKGGMNKIQESGAVLLGGHTINDPELKYGLSVTGIVHPDEIITNSQARPGDVLILTKPLGTGVFTSALKAGRIKVGGMKHVIKSMLTLNKVASEVIQDMHKVSSKTVILRREPKNLTPECHPEPIRSSSNRPEQSEGAHGKLREGSCTDMRSFADAQDDNRRMFQNDEGVGVSACTDVTGFSLIGHAYLMAMNSDVSLVIEHRAVPIFDGALALAKKGFTPCGTSNNRSSYSRYVSIPKHLPEGMAGLLFDPQTSGGLLISVSQNKAQLLLKRLKDKGIKQASIIGRVVKRGQKRIIVE